MCCRLSIWSLVIPVQPMQADMIHTLAIMLLMKCIGPGQCSIEVGWQPTSMVIEIYNANILINVYRRHRVSIICKLQFFLFTQKMRTKNLPSIVVMELFFRFWIFLRIPVRIWTGLGIFFHSIDKNAAKSFARWTNMSQSMKITKKKLKKLKNSI